MKSFVRAVAVFAAVSLFGACSQQAQTANSGMLNSTCAISGEPLDASSPTSDFAGGKVGFCCEKCQKKWDALDDAGKKAALDEHK
ncbi:MAG: hypothetical protein JNL08_11420 [Planctomycetes bacterium]|nr:hypothetical protein [Planctomycetota bacterium]